LRKKISIIVGGTGQFGITLAKLLVKKGHYVIVTSRNISKAKKKISFTHKKLKIIELDILKPYKINKILEIYRPNFLFYFASQSSPSLSFTKKKDTYLSNFQGCKNFLDQIRLKHLNCKFINASSSEIFANTNKKIIVGSKKKPISPYGNSKFLSFNLTKEYRDKFKIETYNALIFNTESIYRETNYLIPKICLAAIRAKKFKKKTAFGNLNIYREWNWCDEQVKYLFKFLSKKPQDFLLSNQKLFSAKSMLKFAFDYFNLNYKNFTQTDHKFYRANDFAIRKSNASLSFKKNKIKFDYKIYGKKIIHRLIKYYLNEKKY